MMYEHKIEIPTEDGEGTETVVLTFRPITRLPIGVLRRHRDNAEAQMWATFEWGLPGDQLEVFDRIPAEEIEPILTAWQKSGSVSVGESPASSASSNGTARRSKPTSSETDSG